FIKAAKLAGLDESQFNIVPLQIQDAQPAFDTGQLDAWVVSEPFSSIEVAKNGARVIADGESLNIPSPSSNIARTHFAKQHPEAIEFYLKVFDKALQYEKEHQHEALDLSSKIQKIDRAVIGILLKLIPSLNFPISQEAIQFEQNTADLLFDLKV